MFPKSGYRFSDQIMRNDKTLGARFLSRFFDRPFFRLALIGALAASLGLAACGRKGPLDPPPSASLAGEQEANKSDIMSNPIAAPIGGQTKDGNPGVNSDGHVQAPKGQKKQIPLDVLLN
jgi:predicted small lipoprotein YifL